jgi:hypothetical protein
MWKASSGPARLEKGEDVEVDIQLGGAQKIGPPPVEGAR